MSVEGGMDLDLLDLHFPGQSVHFLLENICSRLHLCRVAFQVNLVRVQEVDLAVLSLSDQVLQKKNYLWCVKGNDFRELIRNQWKWRVRTRIKIITPSKRVYQPGGWLPWVRWWICEANWERGSAVPQCWMPCWRPSLWPEWSCWSFRAEPPPQSCCLRAASEWGGGGLQIKTIIIFRAIQNRVASLRPDWVGFIRV